MKRSTVLETIGVLTADVRPGEFELRGEASGCRGDVRRVDGGARPRRGAGEGPRGVIPQLPQAERVLLVSQDGDTRELRVRASRIRHADRDRAAPSRTVFDLVTREGHAILCADISADVRLSESDSLGKARVRTIMCVPIWDTERRPVGVLELDAEHRQGRFTQEDLDFLVALATTISMALENARLHDLALRLREWDREGQDARVVQDCLIPRNLRNCEATNSGITTSRLASSAEIISTIVRCAGARSRGGRDGETMGHRGR